MSSYNILLCSVFGPAFKGRTSSEEFVSKDSNTPDVDGVVVVRILNHFRREVVKGPTHSFSAVLGAVGAPPKICELDDSIAIQQILWLYVSVNDVLVVHVLESLDNLVHVLGSFGLRKPFFFLEL